MTNTDKSVAIVKAPWVKAPYYDQAENWIGPFWGEDTPFLRLFKQLDLRSTVELACGHGRHAEKAAKLAGTLTLVDVVEENIIFCKQRLSHFENVKYILNNGVNFRPIATKSITSIYCYDAMVHFSADIVKSYVKDTSRVLHPGGIALYHHSNYCADPSLTANDLSPPDSFRNNPRWRNNMKQEWFFQYARDAGLEVVESTLIPWGDYKDLDCLTLLRLPG